MRVVTWNIHRGRPFDTGRPDLDAVATCQRITIDHVLLRGCCGSAVEYAQRPAVSDHRPIVVEVGQNR